MKSSSLFSIFSKQTCPQLMATLAATVSLIGDGMCYGWASPIVPLLQSTKSPVKIQESEIVWIESLYMLASLIGLVGTTYAVDKFGRKRSILLASCMTLIHWIILSLANNIWMLYIGRILAGFASDMAFVAAPTYIAELADQNIRGFLSSLVYIMLTLGILVIYAVGPFVTIPISSAIGALFVVIQFATLPLMPESPYYLLLQNQNDEAIKALQFFRGTEDVNEELKEIKMAVDRQNLDKGRAIVDLITVDSNRKALILISVLNAAQHFGSISVIFMNLHTIMRDGSAIISANLVGVVFASVLLISIMMASTVIDNLGRKPLLILSSLFSGLSLALLASYFAVKNAGIDVTHFNWVPLAGVLIYAVAFKCGLGLIPFILAAELFPTDVKAIGMTLCDAAYVLSSFISIHFYNFLGSLYGIHVPLFAFAASCILTTTFTIFFIPETKGKTLDEIQMLLKGIPPLITKQP